jgi:hypothetical protein
MSDSLQPLFIIGAPRSGTTMLQVLLGEHPQVATTVELTVFRRYVAPWLATWDEEKRTSDEGKWHQGLPFVWSRAELSEFLRDFTDRVYRKLLASKPGATHVLDKHPANAMHLQVIHEFWPEARFIHLLRDGRDVACSMVSASRKMGFGANTIPGAALEWKKYVTAAREAAAFGEAYLELRYEDLLREGPSAYTRVLDFCKLDYTDDWVKTTLEANSFEKMKASRRTGNPDVPSATAHYRQGRAGSWQDSISLREGFEFERRAGDLLRELGYEMTHDWWKRTPIDGALLPLIASIKDRLFP